MALPSMYTPDGVFAYMVLVIALTLVASVVYLLAFTGASVPF